MVTCLILGMGIPTIPNYIITSSLAGPALLELGVPLLVSHMFVFYFGIMADLTPPVALAAFAAAPMAKVSGQKIGVEATKLAIAGYVVPFMAVYTPALMLQDGGPIAASFGYPVEVAYILLKACLGIVLWGAAVVGFLFAPMAWWERLAAFAAGVLLVLALPLTDEAGFALAVAADRPALVAGAPYPPPCGEGDREAIGWGSRGMNSFGRTPTPPHELHFVPFARRPSPSRGTVSGDLPPRRRQDDGLRRHRLHARLDAFGRKDALGGGLARDAGRPRDRPGARQGLGGRHRPPGRRCAQRWLVDVASGRAGVAASSCLPPQTRRARAGRSARKVVARCSEIGRQIRLLCGRVVPMISETLLRAWRCGARKRAPGRACSGVPADRSAQRIDVPQRRAARCEPRVP